MKSLALDSLVDLSSNSACRSLADAIFSCHGNNAAAPRNVHHVVFAAALRPRRGDVSTELADQTRRFSQLSSPLGLWSRSHTDNFQLLTVAVFERWVDLSSRNIVNTGYVKPGSSRRLIGLPIPVV